MAISIILVGIFILFIGTVTPINDFITLTIAVIVIGIGIKKLNKKDDGT